MPRWHAVVPLVCFAAAACGHRAAMPDPVERPARDRADTVTIRSAEGTELAFDVTPDGRTLIFDLLGQLWSLPIAGGEAVPLTATGGDVADDADPSVSPDGHWIVFRSDRTQGRGLWLRSLADGNLRQLTDSAFFVNNEHLSAAWAPDGRRVAYIARWRLHVRDVATRADTELQHRRGGPDDAGRARGHA